MKVCYPNTTSYSTKSAPLPRAWCPTLCSLACNSLASQWELSLKPGISSGGKKVICSGDETSEKNVRSVLKCFLGNFSKRFSFFWMCVVCLLLALFTSGEPVKGKENRRRVVPTIGSFKKMRVQVGRDSVGPLPIRPQ